jgi:hypothetical protein
MNFGVNSTRYGNMPFEKCNNNNDNHNHCNSKIETTLILILVYIANPRVNSIVGT